MSITIYTKPSCVQCNATYRMMKKSNIDYNIVDLSGTDEEAQQAIIKIQDLGYAQVPVVITDNDHWSGFRPDKINELKESLVHASI